MQIIGSAELIGSWVDEELMQAGERSIMSGFCISRRRAGAPTTQYARACPCWMMYRRPYGNVPGPHQSGIARKG